MDRTRFSNLLVTLRKEKNLTQLDFAELFNVSYQAVSKWENGESLPDITILESISDFYHISINDLLNGNYKTEDDNKKEEEKVIEPPSDNNKTFSSELAKKNLFKIIWCSVSIFLLFMFSLLPIINGTDMFNFYSICFSSNFKFGNFVILLAFILFIAQNVLGIFSSLTKNNKVFLLLEEAFATYCFITIFNLLASNFKDAAVGLYIITMLFAGSWVTLVFCKKLNFSANLNNFTQLQFDRVCFLFIGFIHLIGLCTNSYNTSTSAFATTLYILIYAGLFIASIVFHCILYVKPRNKTFTILYYIFFYLAFISYLIIAGIIINHFAISTLFITIINVVFEIVRNYRNKHALKAQEN